MEKEKIIKPRKIKISSAKRSHRFQMKEINEQCLSENYDISLWERFISQHNSFILSNNSQIIGYCLVSYVNDNPHLQEVNISSFTILPEYRSKGYGKMLLSTVLTYLKSKKYKSVHLHVRISNNIAISLYESLGFKIKERVKDYYSQNKIEENKIEENKIEENKIEENKIEENKIEENEEKEDAYEMILTIN